MVRVGLVAFGMAGRVFHAPLIASVEGMELAAVVERHTGHAAARYPGVATYRSLDELLADASIDLVVVATPSGTHFQVTRQVLEAGKHVVVDKPTAVTSAEIAALIRIAGDHGALLIPFHNRLWDSDFLTLAKVLHGEKLGRVVHLQSTFDRWSPGATRRPWKDDPAQGGGTLLDLGTHLAYQALALFGRPQAVGAEVLRERDGDGCNDSFTVRLYYPDHMVTLASNCLSALPRPRYHLRGTEGSYWKQGVDPQEAALNQITCITAPDWGTEPPSAWGTLSVSAGNGMAAQAVEPVPGDYRVFYAGVRNAVLGKTAAPVEALEAWRTARILEWAEASSSERCVLACDWSGEPV